jgi:hypothetical protein
MNNASLLHCEIVGLVNVHAELVKKENKKDNYVTYGIHTSCRVYNKMTVEYQKKQNLFLSRGGRTCLG